MTFARIIIMQAEPIVLDATGFRHLVGYHFVLKNIVDLLASMPGMVSSIGIICMKTSTGNMALCN